MVMVSGSTSWDVANQKCAGMGKALCSRTAICPTKLKPPFDGMKKGDEWTPVIDSPNSWVSIGDYDPSNRLCRTHQDSLGVKPAWGTTADVYAFRKRIYCC
jgi:hypothetical protein